MGFCRSEYWSGEPFPSPGDLPNPDIELRSPCLPHCRWILYQLSHQRSKNGKILSEIKSGTQEKNLLNFSIKVLSLPGHRAQADVGNGTCRKLDNTMGLLEDGEVPAYFQIPLSFVHIQIPYIYIYNELIYFNTYIYSNIYITPIFCGIPNICLFIRKLIWEKDIWGMIILIFVREGLLVTGLYFLWSHLPK